jgi:hypothetical protein
MNTPSQRTDRQIPPGAFERWLAQGQAERREFRVRRFFLPAAVFASIAAVPWFISNSGLRGPSVVSPAPQHSHQQKHSESRASSSTGITHGSARTSSEAPPTLQVSESEQIAAEKPIERPARNSESATTIGQSEITGGRIGDPANTAGIVPSKPMLPEHAVLEIRDGKVVTGDKTSGLPRAKGRGKAAPKWYTERPRRKRDRRGRR